MKKRLMVSIWLVALYSAGYVSPVDAIGPIGNLKVQEIIRSCERQEDNACVIKKGEEALLQSSPMTSEEHLAIRYELAARYEYYNNDLKKALDMYVEIEKLDPDYGITKLSIKRLNARLSKLAKR